MKMPQNTRRDFIRTAAFLAATPLFPPLFAQSAGTAAAKPPSPAQQPGLTPRWRNYMASLKGKGLLGILPVLAAPEGDISHLGFPVATQLSDGRAVVVFHRAEGGHILAGRLTERPMPSGRYAITSDDLLAWHPADPFTARNRLGPPDGMHCVGAALKADGKERVVALATGVPKQVYVSDDRGETWRAVDGALAGKLDGAAHCGPRLIQHPEFGLVAALGQQKNPSARRNWLVRSLDAGETWEQRVWVNTAHARSVEPAVATWGDGHMVMIAREYVQDFALNEEGYYCHTQHVYRHTKGAPFSEVSFTTARTNIAGNPAFGFDCHDTADVSYNPVTKRIECLHSHRRGGGEGRTGKIDDKNPANRVNTLNLWSISPDELLAGSSTWRFECTLVERQGYSRNSERDGMHPGGTIIDLKRKQQHIFIYAGWRRKPCSIFRLSRTLDTPALADAWRKARLA